MLQLHENPFAVEDIVAAISLECLNKGVDVPEQYIKFILFSVLLNPDHSFSHDRSEENKEMHKLIDLCVGILCEEDSPKSITFKFQAYLTTDVGDKELWTRRHHEEIFTHTEALIRNIIKSVPKTVEEIKKLTRKIVLVIVLLSGLGDPSDPLVYKEALVAYKSVFNMQDLNKFIHLSPEEKLAQLKELTRLVAGIRIFNAVRGKGGDGIQNLPPLLEGACEAMKQKVDTMNKEFEKYISNVEAFLLNFLHWDGDFKDKINVSLPPTYREYEFKCGKELLVMLQQVYIYLRYVKRDVDKCRDDVAAVDDYLSTKFTKLQNDVRFKAAVPTRVVFPQFIGLADYWTSLQDIMLIISTYDHILIVVKEIVQIQEVPDVWQNIMNGSTQEGSGSGRDEEGQSIDPSTIRCTLLLPTDNHPPLQYNGFCPVYAVEGEGFAVKGDVSLGILKFRDKFYAFKNANAAHLFGKNPILYIRKVIDFVRRNPEFVCLLNLQSEASEVMDPAQVAPPEKGSLQRERGVQTELHPVQSNIDTKYKWNEWDLKRDALRLVQLAHSKTKGSQTIAREYKKDIWTQTYDTKEAWTCTKRDAASAAAPALSFLYGLRGRKEVDPCKLDLSKPILSNCPEINY